MSKKKKIIGYVVVEYCDDFEQILGLDDGENMPPGGILAWRDSYPRDPCAIFADRKAARAAIVRTTHYAAAFGRTDLPERILCRIDPVRMVEEATP